MSDTEVFNTSEYRNTLVKILDIARDSHHYFTHTQVALHADVAKTYIWAASLVSGLGVMLAKEITVGAVSAWVLVASLVMVTVTVGLALLVLWGRGTQLYALDDPLALSQFSFEQFSSGGAADVQVYAGLIAAISEANRHNKSRNMKRAQKLRIAAPCLFLSLVLLLSAAIMHHV